MPQAGQERPVNLWNRQGMPHGSPERLPHSQRTKRASRMRMSGRRLGMIRKEEVEEKERFSSTLFV